MPPALGDPRIRDLAARVEVRADTDMSPRRADHPTARVEVRLKGGRVLTGVTSVGAKCSAVAGGATKAASSGRGLSQCMVVGMAACMTGCHACSTACCCCSPVVPVTSGVTVVPGRGVSLTSNDVPLG